MLQKTLNSVVLFVCSFLVYSISFSQHISQLTSLSASPQDNYIHLSEELWFHELLKVGDLTATSSYQPNFDFTGYVPINGSSTHGYLSISFENTPGGMAIAEIQLDTSVNRWEILSSRTVDFSVVGGTARNCSGTVTPWGTIITCEEQVFGDDNNDGYNDIGWAIEVDPVTARIVDFEGGLVGGDKLWGLGNFNHENIVVHSNKRTVYQGVDATVGYLFKFVADEPERLNKGKLYVYKGDKTTGGIWVQLKNSTPLDQNTVLAQADSVKATVFNGVEDVEINPLDGSVCFAVKGEDKVYRFVDVDPLLGDSVLSFETFVGGRDYDIQGVQTSWGTGNDNLAFDDLGNLWVLQDGGDNHVWLVGNDHTQENPNVKIVMKTPKGSEPTGITFTPDFKFLFMSIQHPSTANETFYQQNAFGESISFGKDIALVISLKEHLSAINNLDSADSFLNLYPNPTSSILTIDKKIKLWKVVNSDGEVMLKGKDHPIDVSQLLPNIYFLEIGNETYRFVKN